MKETINDRVINLFKTLNLDVQKVALDVEMHPKTISRILDKETEPSKSTVKAIAEATNANFDYLMYGKGEMLKADKSKANVDPWKEEAYAQKDKLIKQVEQERDYFKSRFDEIMNAIISGKLGKLLALSNNAGTKLRKVA